MWCLTPNLVPNSAFKTFWGANNTGKGEQQIPPRAPFEPQIPQWTPIEHPLTPITPNMNLLVALLLAVTLKITKSSL